MKPFFMRSYECVAAALFLMAGCSQTLEVADSAQARTALQQALETWKQGQPPKAIQDQDPAIYCNDEDWLKGRRLRSYEIADTDDHFGGSCRIAAQLDLEGAGRTPMRKKKIVYLIDIDSAIVIVRGR
jgi:hypothetical protein